MSKYETSKPAANSAIAQPAGGTLPALPKLPAELADPGVVRIGAGVGLPPAEPH
jgi:hypothetical protein